MDKTGLQNIFNIQKANDDFWYDREKFRADRAYRMSVVKDFVLGIYDQTNKLMDAFDWKKHTLNAVEDRQNAIEQCIDINKYVIGLLSLMGVEPEEFADQFELKSSALMERWKSLDKMTSEVDVMVFDIDGVIADYDNEYKEFCKTYYYLTPSEEERTSYSYYKMFGISKMKEEEIHSEFIKMGGFRKLKSYDGIKELISTIRSYCVKVVLLTARPSWVYKRLITDTYWWLKNEGIEYDLLLWDKDKAETMLQYVFPANILYFVEDRDKHAIEISHLGVDVLLLNKEYNGNISDSDHIKRVYSYDEIKELFLEKLRNERMSKSKVSTKHQS